jgi:hypothetical protein
MSTKTKNPLQDLLAELTPEELEPRLELQIFFDPMTSLADTNNNNNNNNNKEEDPVIWV